MIKTIPQAIDDIAISLGASPSAEIPTVAQALENVYTALGGDRTDLDTLVLPEVIDLVAPLIQGGGGGGGDFTVTIQTINMPQTTLAGRYDAEEQAYVAEVKIADLDESIVNGVPYGEIGGYDYDYYIYGKGNEGSISSVDPYKTIDGVDVYMQVMNVEYELHLYAYSSEEFSVVVPADTIEFYRASKDVADTFKEIAVLSSK